MENKHINIVLEAINKCWDKDKLEWVWCYGDTPIGKPPSQQTGGGVVSGATPCADLTSIRFDPPVPTAGLIISTTAPNFMSGKTTMQAGFSYDFAFTYIIPKCCLTDQSLMPPPGGGPPVYWFVGDGTITDPNNLGITIATFPIIFFPSNVVAPFSFPASFTIDIPATVPLNQSFHIIITFFMYPFGGIFGQCKRTLTVDMTVRFI